MTDTRNSNWNNWLVIVWGDDKGTRPLVGPELTEVEARSLASQMVKKVLGTSSPLDYMAISKADWERNKSMNCPPKKSLSGQSRGCKVLVYSQDGTLYVQPCDTIKPKSGDCEVEISQSLLDEYDRALDAWTSIQGRLRTVCEQKGRVIE